MKYLTRFADKNTALEFTTGGRVLKAPQVSKVGNDAIFSESIKRGKSCIFVEESDGRLKLVELVETFVTFTALEDNCSIGFYNNPDSSVNPTIEYSFDKNNWNILTEDKVSIPQNANMYCRGLNPNGISGGYGERGYNYFTGEGKFNVSGDIMSIIDYENTPETMVGTFYNLFGGNIDTSRDNFVDIVDASGLVLSARILTDDCYQRMFSACTSMTHGPQIKAEVLAPYCCWGMFIECISLTTAPELPATTLAPYCYQSMFFGCISLTTAPELPAMKLAKNCYCQMFYGCTSLTTAPAELPATTLAGGCYNVMFNSCTSLITAPELPATTLTNDCYFQMFSGCNKLNHIKCLATDISATDCISAWVAHVSPTGTFIKHPNMTDWSTSGDGVPEGWTVVDAEL